MAAANAAWQGYQTVQSVRDLAGGRKNIGEIGISISYRQQKNRSEVRSDLSRIQESRINAGGKKSRTAKAAPPEAASARETSRLPTPPNSSAAAARAYNRLRKASTPIGVPRLPTPPQAT